MILSKSDINAVNYFDYMMECALISVPMDFLMPSKV